MAPRTNWKGCLKLSLVSCAVALYPATAGISERVSFAETRRQLLEQAMGYQCPDWYDSGYRIADDPGYYRGKPRNSN
jgi:hypothetical protein